VLHVLSEVTVLDVGSVGCVTHDYSYSYFVGWVGLDWICQSVSWLDWVKENGPTTNTRFTNDETYEDRGLTYSEHRKKWPIK